MKKIIVLMASLSAILCSGISFYLHELNKKSEIIVNDSYENTENIILEDNKGKEAVENTKEEYIDENTISFEKVEKQGFKETTKEPTITKENNLIEEKRNINEVKEEKTKEEIKEYNVIQDNKKVEIEQNNISADQVNNKSVKHPNENKKQEIIENKEEYRYNDVMTQKIINIINNNPSEYMQKYSYNLKKDESIVLLTNQFTFSENRVKSKIKNKFGEIKVYAQDYYLNDTYIATECYIY